MALAASRIAFTGLLAAGRSHGCVNTRGCTATRTLFNSVGIGTRLIVY